MYKIVIESPFKAPTEEEAHRNAYYLKRAVRAAVFENDENPYASHAFFAQFLDDGKVEERKLGIQMGLERAEEADYVVVMVDYGISDGMQQGIKHWMMRNKKILFRTIGPNDAPTIGRDYTQTEYWPI